MEDLLLIVLIVLGFLFGLPIAAWVSARRTRAMLADRIDSQRTELAHLTAHLLQLRRDLDELARGGPRTDAGTRVVPPSVVPPPAPVSETVRYEPPPVEPESVEVPEPVGSAPVDSIEPEPVAAHEREHVGRAEPAAQTPRHRTEWGLPETVSVPFDWENLVGVKLFSGVAGVALVVAAVFFLRYSMERGWLQPGVRVLIGVAVSIGLLVLCELKAARRYPATANALDAAAIAILFATFFSAHALWHLIPSIVAFALLAVVTVLAVLLSVRRQSLFIAVLGLVGGFATPALLSRGENQPVPLFAYLMLLNVGLAWVAYRQGWTILTWLTLFLTTIYQWVWVFRFLHESSLPLAMGIFLVFPVAAAIGLFGARRGMGSRVEGELQGGFERTVVLSAGLPLLFAVYVAAVPQPYEISVPLFFGFLLLLDAGLLAIAIALPQELLHVVGAIGTLVVTAVWVWSIYPDVRSPVALLAFTSLLASLYLAAPIIARGLRRPLGEVGLRAQYAAPLLLFVFAALAPLPSTPAFPLFAALLALVLAIAWRAATTRAGALYFVAAFFAIATQATWSAAHLSGVEQLPRAVLVYLVFGVASIAIPAVARRAATPLLPRWGSGAVLLASLGLLLFLSAGGVAPAALWALALLLAILNAGLFVESASGSLPLLSQAGTIVSWLVLANWWAKAGASVGVLSSLTVLTALALITLGGHVWSYLRSSESRQLDFTHGLYLGLLAHLFLFFLAINPEWSVPPWPLFGALAVVTLATSAASIATATMSLHAGGVVAAALVLAGWAAATTSPQWGVVALIGSAAVSAYALICARPASRLASFSTAAAAATTLFVGEAAVILAVDRTSHSPAFAAALMAHAANIVVLLWLAWRERWRYVAIAAVIPAWMGAVQWGPGMVGRSWIELLVITGTLYAIFVIYPLVLGRRAGDDRAPYLAAVAASAMAFFCARAAFIAGGLEWAVGIVPVVICAILALLLRELLRIQPPGGRDLTRLATVAGASLAFLTIAIPLQLEHQWITIGWALEGAALAWLYHRIPHRGLLHASAALLTVVFVRLALNPEVFRYAPRGSVRVLNWYLYTYLVAGASCLFAARWLSKTEDRLLSTTARASRVLPVFGVVLLFFLLNIEIADFFAAGPSIAFRFGASVSQDLTYTIGWLVFAMILLASGIYVRSRSARIAAVALITVTTLKCFFYDLASLEGLARVGSFVGLGLSLALVSLVLQKYVLSRPKGTT